MKLPVQANPVIRTVSTTLLRVGKNYLQPSAGTCDCNWHGFMCDVVRDNCDPGYHPDCYQGFLQCSCDCVPD